MRRQPPSRARGRAVKPRAPLPAPMEPHPRDPGRAAWALPCLLLLALPGVSAQGFILHQPQDKVSVVAGETLTLNCTTSGMVIIGGVRWLKGWGSENKTIYDQRQEIPRVTRAVNGSDTDFTIHIRNVTPEDMGTYYCVKYQKRDTGEEEVFQRSNGTEVSVQAKPSPVLVSGPEARVRPGQTVPFTCTTGGFFPKEIVVKWFKNKKVMMAQPPPQITGLKTYNMSSTVNVTLQKDDVPSELTCEVQHSTLSGQALRGSFQLSRVLRVPPSVEVSAEPSPAEVNRTVTFTCLVKEFYPANVSISWWENGIEIKVKNVSYPSMLPKGLFRLESQVEVQAMEEKNGSRITCKVVHDAQAPANTSAFLWISKPAQGELNDMLIYIVVGVVCTVLALLVAAILYLIRTKQIKGKSSPSARLHEPEKSSEATTQESDPNNLTYADLNFERERKTIRRMVELSQQSEYACIQSNRAPNGDDNLTYADLDMVHLSKAPKRPAPRPEETGSEYASVQITRK